jgi:hypothetical protein
MSALAHGLNAAFWQPDLRMPAPREEKPQGLTNWVQLPLPRKATQPEGTIIFEITQAQAMFQQGMDHITQDIEQLKAAYVFADRSIERFLTDHRALPAILRAAIEPLKTSFGADKVFRLELSIEEDDSKMLYGVALWRDTARAAAQALDNFAESWWLDHMTTSTTALAFTYELA